VINYPIYSYRCTVSKLSDNQAEVKMTIRYAMSTPREYNKGPNLNRTMYFHYSLNLNDAGEIVGGQYYGDGSRVDMLWTPLMPTQGGQKGNERGNPHVDIKEVLAIWRASVSEETRKKWLNVDPTAEDAILPVEEPAAPAAEKKEEPAKTDKPADEKKEEMKPEVKPADPATPTTPPSDATSPAAAPPAAPAEPAPATPAPATEPAPTTPTPATEPAPAVPAPATPAPTEPAPATPE
ncbi:MAG TPA: hypothetical protein VL096_06190, partial [Pirellulaceae bacterium]|nr:hypothetical protein [Pirellulaceae bacterium]